MGGVDRERSHLQEVAIDAISALFRCCGVAGGIIQQFCLRLAVSPQLAASCGKRKTRDASGKANKLALAGGFPQ